MSLLSMLSQNRLLQQNPQAIPQLTQPFQVILKNIRSNKQLKTFEMVIITIRAREKCYCVTPLKNISRILDIRLGLCQNAKF